MFDRQIELLAEMMEAQAPNQIVPLERMVDQEFAPRASPAVQPELMRETGVLGF
ncbi:MAG: hypothetical protein J5J06_20400 [Phycisphaerae bacterium]|nr:hypothetical protein [Phycisphaerae bacterium]